MTKKDYVEAAKRIQNIQDKDERLKTAKFIADFFAADNSRFKRDSFFVACCLNK